MLIKFRVWDARTKKFTYCDVRSSMGNLPLDIPDEDVHLCSGMHEKGSTREIYAEDIVKCYLPIQGYSAKDWDWVIRRVKYDPIDASFMTLEVGEKTASVGGFLVAGGEIILGNTYENPELLK